MTQVKVVADVGGVGQNLQDHLGVYGLAWTIKPNTVSMENAFSFPSISQYVHHRKGQPWGHAVRGAVCRLFWMIILVR